MPAVVRLFLNGGDADQRLATEMLGQITSPASSGHRASLAVFATPDDVRSMAVQTLRDRDWRDFARPLVEMIHTLDGVSVPARSRKPGTKGMLVIDTPRQDRALPTTPRPPSN